MADTRVHPEALHQPWEILGYRADGRPIYPIAGGADDGDDGDESGSDGDEDSDGDGDGDGSDDWTPPTKEEFEALQAKLKKANTESAARRKKLAELQQQHEDADTKAQREAADAAIAKYKPVAVKAAAKAAFLEQGANSARVDRLFRMLDLDAIEFDGDDITGLDEQVEELKADVPELFSGKKSDEDTNDGKTKAPKLTAAGRKPGQEQLTPGDLIVRQVFGRR